MSVPSLVAYLQGQGAAGADDLNTLVRGGALVSDLQSFSGLQNMTVYLIGGASPGDGLQGTFYWNASWTGTPDNINSVQPYAALLGAWVRLPLVVSGGVARYANTGGADAMLATDSLIVWNYAFSGTKTESILSASSVANNYRVTVKDGYGDSAVNPIVITPLSGTIDGSSSKTINAAFGSLTLAAVPATNSWYVV